MSLLKLSQEPRSGGRFLNLAESCCQGCSSVNPMNHPTWSIPNNPITQIENRWELGWPHPLISFGSVWTSSRKKTGTSEALFVSLFFTLYLYNRFSPCFVPSYLPIYFPIFLLNSPYLPIFVMIILPLPMYLPGLIFGGTSHPRFPPPF
jgi:hypothetical protein